MYIVQNNPTIFTTVQKGRGEGSRKLWVLELHGLVLKRMPLYLLQYSTEHKKLKFISPIFITNVFRPISVYVTPIKNFYLL